MGIMNDNSNMSKKEIANARLIVENKIKQLRDETPNVKFEHNKLAELEINKFFYENKTVNRVMIVLRANGCEHYKKDGGCSMCSHFNGTDRSAKITTKEYIEQWQNVINGIGLSDDKFNLNDYPVVCVYNLGSLLNENEINEEAVQYIFSSLNQFKGVKKVIIESRAEYVTEKAIKNIVDVYDGVVEIGIGVESTNNLIREICHHKGIDNVKTIQNAVDIIHRWNFKALAYINFKPIFLTESEAIDDAIQTSVDCFYMNFDAISIEPTSLQDYSLANKLYQIGQYRVPWLWSIRDIVKGVYDKVNDNVDLRIGGYFDEEILSGSQGVGFNSKNEIFPHMTSLNCDKCSKKLIECIKRYNMTYDIKTLFEIEECDICYDLWKEVKNIKDSRDLITRVYDIFGNEV